jgi:hypothetical protein
MAITTRQHHQQQQQQQQRRRQHPSTPVDSFHCHNLKLSEGLTKILVYPIIYYFPFIQVIYSKLLYLEYNIVK